MNEEELSAYVWFLAQPNLILAADKVFSNWKPAGFFCGYLDEKGRRVTCGVGDSKGQAVLAAFRNRDKLNRKSP